MSKPTRSDRVLLKRQSWTAAAIQEMLQDRFVTAGQVRLNAAATPITTVMHSLAMSLAVAKILA